MRNCQRMSRRYISIIHPVIINHATPPLLVYAVRRLTSDVYIYGIMSSKCFSDVIYSRTSKANVKSYTIYIYVILPCQQSGWNNNRTVRCVRARCKPNIIGVVCVWRPLRKCRVCVWRMCAHTGVRAPGTCATGGWIVRVKGDW